MGSKIEIITYFGQCTCCHRYAYLKSMWDKHEWKGEIETYGEMLCSCFGLNTWYTTNEDQDRICEECMTRLRDACQFKTQVLKIQESFRNGVVEKKKEIKTEYNTESEMSDDENFEYIEYLDEDILDINNEIDERQPVRKRKPRSNSGAGECGEETETEVSETKPKWPKKLPVSQRYQTYKQYTADDFRNCIEVIKRNEMSAKEASMFFKIPFKTVTAKIRRGILEQENPIPLTTTRELIEDIKTILRYTNATPFKTRFNTIWCAFCTEICHFDYLRTHTVEAHRNRIDRVEAMLRPYYDNQILKIDIQDLKCTVCNIPALYWTDMLEHLSSEHNLTLKQAKTKIIPFKLSDNIHCAICDKDFSAFMLVDAHMNRHYNNYACSDCGETFVSLPRLKNHERTHEIGKYKCHLCDKVFHLNTYRKRHILTMHYKSDSLFKCGHCTERFMTEALRQKHIIAAHIDKIKVIHCEICGAMFYFNKTYRKHLRRKHKLVSK